MVIVFWKFVVVGILFGVSWFLLFIYALMDSKKISGINEIDKIEIIGSYIGRAILLWGVAACVGVFIPYICNNNKNFSNAVLLLPPIALDIVLVVLAVSNTSGFMTEEGRLERLEYIRAARICKIIRLLSEKLIYILIGFALLDIPRLLSDIDKNREKEEMITSNIIYIGILTLICFIVSKVGKHLHRKQKKWMQRLGNVLMIIPILILGLMLFWIFYIFVI